MKAIFIKQLLLGSLENFTYIVGDRESGEVFVIDPSASQSAILRELKVEKFELKGIFLTHGHYDHVVDVDKFDVPVYLSEAESSLYTPKAKQFIRTSDAQKIPLGAFTVEVIHTPGHTPGCQCFLVDGNLFTGDTLFMDAVGRTDFPGGSTRILFESLQKIKRLPDTTMVWPGHNYGTVAHETLGSLKKYNPFLVCTDIHEFMGYLS
jgi:glyoxylase-like metal-dependent hydrolase (beta-lactamase superfamily II)